MQWPRRLAHSWLCCLAWCHGPSWGAHAALRRAAQHWEPQQAQIPPGSDVYYVPAPVQPAPKLAPAARPEVLLPPALKAPGQYLMPPGQYIMQPGTPFAAPPPAAQQPQPEYEPMEEEPEEVVPEAPPQRHDPNDDLPLDSFMPAPAAPPVRDRPTRPKPQSAPTVMMAPPEMEYQQSEPMVMEPADQQQGAPMVMMPPAMENQQQSAPMVMMPPAMENQQQSAPMVMMPPAMMPAQAAGQQVMQVGWAVVGNPLNRISNYFENCLPNENCRGNGDRVRSMHEDIDQLAQDCATPGKVIDSSSLRGNGERLFRGSVQLMQDFRFMRGSIIRMGLKCFMDANEYRNKFATFGMIDEVIKTMRDATMKNTKTDHKVMEAVFRDSLDILRKFAEGSKVHQWQAVKAGAAEAILPEMQKYGLAPKSHACPTLIALYNHYQADMLTATVLDTQCEVQLQSPPQWQGLQ